MMLSLSAMVLLPHFGRRVPFDGRVTVIPPPHPDHCPVIGARGPLNAPIIIASPYPSTPGTQMASSHIFKVLFVNQGKIYEIYARHVAHGDLFGFIEVEELVFGERSTVVVDPAEEKIKSEFEGVKRTYLPLHSILRIDQVRKQGVSKISAYEGSNVAQFPVPIFPAGGDPGAKR
jgi:hypothetical protein